MPKWAFIATSPHTRNAFKANFPMTRMTVRSPDGHLIYRAIQAVARWLGGICTKPEVYELPIPDTTTSWYKALELRMTAVELGMGHYVDHFGVEYLRVLGGRDVCLDEARIVFKTRDCNPEDDSDSPLKHPQNLSCLGQGGAEGIRSDLIRVLHAPGL